MVASIRLTVASDLDTVRLVALAVRAMTEERLSADKLDEIELALVEAVTNVIQHGYEGRAEEHLTVGLSMLSDRVVLEIADTAKPMDAALWSKEPSEPVELRADEPEDLPEGGMGLALIRATMDEVLYRQDGGANILRMTKHYTSRD